MRYVVHKDKTLKFLNFWCFWKTQVKKDETKFRFLYKKKVFLRKRKDLWEVNKLSPPPLKNSHQYYNI